MDLPSVDHTGTGLSAPILVRRSNFVPSRFTSHKSHGKPCASHETFWNRDCDAFATTPGTFFFACPEAAKTMLCISGENRIPKMAAKLSLSNNCLAPLPSILAIHRLAVY